MVLVKPAASLRLADVLTSSYLALSSKENPFGLSGVKKAAVLVVDGLGATNLRARSGHARWLSQAWSLRSLEADSGFPSTTASALSSLTTGVLAGSHGLVGYTIRDPDSGQMINHLKDWNPPVDPGTWQRQPTIFETSAGEGIPSLSLGEPRFEGTDFTKAVWRGSEYRGVSGFRAQAEAMREFFDTNDRGLCYLYWPALDRTGHSSGAGSDAWTHRLEDLDVWCAELNSLLRDDEGLIITADHGMLDIAPERKMVVEAGSALLDGVEAWGGEPRVPQLYISDPGAVDAARDAWQETLGVAAVVATREQTIDENWFGPMGPGVAPRIGDIVLACVEPFVIYQASTASPASLRMVGQHGSITATERLVPIIPLGAWA